MTFFLSLSLSLSKQIGGHIDIWALGITLIEAWTGQRPHDEYSQGLQLVYAIAVLRKTPRVPRDTPSALAELIRDCWEIDPLRRPKALEVQRRLEEELARVTAEE